MTNNIAITDDMNAVERWENEGGKVSPFNSLWIPLKSFKMEGRSLSVQESIDADRSTRKCTAVHSFSL